MLFLLTRRLSRSYLIIILMATNLVISMPAPPIKRSPENVPELRNGFSNVPKILEIQLPLKIASKDDLVAWARYVMGLMASKINITLTTVKETPATTSGNTRAPEIMKNIDNTKQPQIVKDSVYRKSQSVNQMGGVRNLASIRNPENIRYAANVGNLGNMKNFEVPANIRPSSENGRRSEVIRIPLRNGNIQSLKEKQLASPQLSTLTIDGVTGNSLFNNRQSQPSFTNVGLFDTTIPNPLEITANINLPRTKESIFKGVFSTAKILEPPLVIPQFPDFGPGIDFKNDLTKNFSLVSTPARSYLPVTTTDNIKIPNDPFVTRYFFDGVERNVPHNLAIFTSNITFTTSNPLNFNDEIPIPIRNIELLPQRNFSGIAKPLLKVPFEAVITFSRENSGEATTWRNDKDKYLLIPTRDPPDDFPPYFDTNYTLTNESGQINVVFDDNKQVTEPINNTKKEEKKKQGKKQDSSKTQQSNKQKSEKGRPSVVSQFLKTFLALRRNNSLATNLKPPPLNPEKLTTPSRAPMAPVAQKVPTAQKYPSPPRVQSSYNEKPSFVSGQGRRGQTFQAQRIEDGDDNGSNSGSNSEESTEKNDADEDNGNDNEDVESSGGDDNSDSNESSSSESDEDSEEEGGLVSAIISLLELAAPILEDLSDPESDADIGDVLSAGLPLIQELSEGDDENPGFDIPGILVPVLLKVSEDQDGPKDSSAVLTPLIQLIAPLIGPLVGPLILPLSRQISNPPGDGGSSVSDLIRSLLGPLLEPVGPGKKSQLSNLVAAVISSLSKYSSTYGKSDIASLVKAVVTGTIAGSSAASNHKDSYGHHTDYGGDSYRAHPSTNTYAAVPPKEPNPLSVLGDSIKDILNAIVKVVSSLVNAITGILSASSGSSEEPSPTYGAPRPTYGPPRPTYSTSRPTYDKPRSTYNKPRPSQYFAVPPSESISITTSGPKRFLRL
nr:uncharacterized protein LOC117600193 isoform X1 [Osmia lignaria]